MSYQISIGIDPGVQNGFAVWDSLKKDFIKILTLKFHPLLKQLDFYQATQEGRFQIVLEATYLNKPVWHGAQNKAIAGSIAQRVGSNQRTAQLIKEYCEEYDLPLVEVKPGKNSYTKLSQKKFEQLTGCRIKTSEHGRDAAMLVYGRC
jgi:hypothetical protein